MWSQLLDPVARPAHRKWVTADIDLAAHAGRGREVIFETRGYEKGDDDARRAFWGEPVLTVADRDAPLVIVYLVDTLRADHTTPYGYKRDTTPELAAFARDAVVFEQAIAQASWTKPSVASLLTSQLPGRHRAVQLRDTLDAGLTTLPEMLQAKGYSTGGAVANSVIYGVGTNFEQGFDYFAGLHGAGDRPSKAVDADVVVDAGLGFLDARRGFPRFLYVHTMDPHVPYGSPPPFDRKFDPPPAPDRPAADPRSDYREPVDKDRLIAQYDGAIAFGDREFGRFVRELKARGLYDRALIVFIADHGEEFLDHGQWTHGKTVFDELIRIPLVVKFPQGRNAGARVAQQVQAVDVLPTVLQALDLPVPAPPVIAGRPLQVVLAGGAPEPPAVSEISHRGFVAHGMRTSRDKYVQRFSPEEDELYFDLVQDPKETISRVDHARERVRFLKGGIEAAMAPNPFRYTLRFEGTEEFEVRAQDRRLDRGRRAGRLRPRRPPRDRRQWTPARAEGAAAPGPAARDRVRRPADGRAGGAGGHEARATAGALRRSHRPGGGAPGGAPVQASRDRDREGAGREHLCPAAVRASGRPRVAGHDRGQETSGGDGPRDLRAAEGAGLHRRRLPGPLSA